MTPLRILIVAFYLVRCPVIAYRMTASALELARVSSAAGATTYATEPSTRHPALSKTSHQNLRAIATERLDLRLGLNAESIALSDIDHSNRLDSRQVPVRSPPSAS
jgi:hypothetical protein